MVKKAQAVSRFVTEVAPPQVVPVMRRGNKVPRSLDTIAEDDREQLAYGPPSPLSDSDHHQLGFAAAWTRRAPAAAPQVQERERAASGFMRELSNYFSDAHGHSVSTSSRPAPVAGRVATS